MVPNSIDKVFHALAHPSRRQILATVRKAPGCSVNDVCRGFKVSRIAVMKHLACLEAAALINSEKNGRKRALYFNASPIQMIYDYLNASYNAQKD